MRGERLPTIRPDHAPHLKSIQDALLARTRARHALVESLVRLDVAMREQDPACSDLERECEARLGSLWRAELAVRRAAGEAERDARLRALV